MKRVKIWLFTFILPLSVFGARPLGEECQNNEECESNICTDGVCCNSLCKKTCEACNLEETKGTCTPIPEGEDPDQECKDLGKCISTCNGKRACRPKCKEKGSWCQKKEECETGFCEHNTCCETECKDKCKACDLPLSKGRCEYVPAGFDPHLNCPKEPECKSTCNGKGKCEPPCKGLGESCTSDHECAKGYCQDKVCCNTRCQNPCEKCNSKGICENLPKGSKDKECPEGKVCDQWGKCISLKIPKDASTMPDTKPKDEKPQEQKDSEIKGECECKMSHPQKSKDIPLLLLVIIFLYLKRPQNKRCLK
jgi:hypothetical protein